LSILGDSEGDSAQILSAAILPSNFPTALEMREPEKNENRQKQLGRQNQSPRPKTHNRREFAKPLERENGSR
jgi:hypothetical protein